MVLNHTETTIAYRCPSCGAAVFSIVGVFRLSGDLIRLKCPCGESELSLSYTRDRKVRLTVPCFVCPRPHQFVLSPATFFSEELFSIPCALSGLDICFIGKQEEVSAAMEKSEQELLSMLNEAGLDDCDSLEHLAGRSLHTEKSPVGGDGAFDEELNFPDNHIHDLVNFVVRDLEAEGKIACRCEAGDGEYELLPEGDHVTVRCRKCGARAEIPCNNSLFANAFLEYDALQLK